MKKILVLVIIILSISLNLISDSSQVKSESNTFNSEYVKTEKTAKYNHDDNVIEYNLSAFQDSKITAVQQKVPLDVVLVLDSSSSMDGWFSEKGYVRLKTYHYQEEIETMGRLFYESSETQKNNIFSLNHDGFSPIQVYENNGLYKIVDDKGMIIQSGNANTPLHDFYYTYSSSPVDRMQALQVSVDKFLKMLQHSSDINGINHRVAFVSFSGELRYDQSQGTGLLSTNSESEFIPFYKATKDIIADSLINVTEKEKMYLAGKKIKKEVDYTATHLGMDLARKIVKENQNESRKTKVILFTDGEPNGSPEDDLIEIYPSFITYDSGIEYGYSEVDTDPNYASANEAVKQAHIIKKVYNTDVFSVVIHEHADPIGALNVNQIANNASIIDRFMHLASSNYSGQDLKKVTDPYSITDTKFYKDAKTGDDLKDVFELIFEEIIETEEIHLGEDTIIYDSLPEVLNLEELSTNNVKVYTEDYLGNGAWSASTLYSKANVEIDSTKRAVKVSGFDFTHHLVNKERKGGKRIIISFSVPVKPGFIGGNNILTNGFDSGIYPKGTEEAISLFPVPIVDIPLKFDIFNKNHAIYISNEFDLNDLLYQDGHFKYKLDGREYELDGINNKYVDIDIDVKHEGSLIKKLTIPRGAVFNFDDFKLKKSLITDARYEISYSLRSDQFSKTKKNESSVFTFWPSIEVNDTESFLGKAMKLDSNYNGNVKWLSSDSNIHQLKPDTKYKKPVVTLSVDNFKFGEKYYLEETTDFKYTVLLDGDADYHQYVSKNQEAFRHSIKTLKMHVRKNIEGKAKKSDNFKFSVNWLGINGEFPFEEGSYNLDFIIKGNESYTISGLPIGNYEVFEDLDWSWRYEVVGESNQKVELEPIEEEVEVIFTNKLKDKKPIGTEVIKENYYE